MGSSTLTLDSSFYPGRKIGPFTLVQELGHGSFGVVWLANHKMDLVITQRAVKLPKTDDVDLEAFAKEAKVWVEASGHTNILELITADIYSNQVLIASPYIPNGTLANWLEKNKGKDPPIESAITFVKGILEGLKHLHSKNIIHRDLKPKNILLQGSTPLIADFGLARVLRQDSSTLKTAGTPQYMSPEIWRNGDRCFEADLWAVGIILYEILVGKRPFEKSNGRSIDLAILNDPLPTLPESIPDNLRYIITKSLEKEKINRFRSAEEMLRQLETHLIPEGHIFSSVKILSPNEKTPSDHKSFRDLPGKVWCPELVEIEPGKFFMGASDDDTDAYPDEKPQHEVVLKYRFAIGKYLVTVAEFNHFCSETGRIFPKTVEGCCEECPVTNITWCDADEYVKWLSKKTSQEYRLPTEAEWEYCCRAGTTTRFYFGDEIDQKNVNLKVGNEVGRPTKVGSFPPNRWGIHDMHGNVWEYVADSWHKTYENAPADGSAWIDSAEIPDSTIWKVVRGGSFSYAERENRSSVRCFYESQLASDDQHGFRVARSL